MFYLDKGVILMSIHVMLCYLLSFYLVLPVKIKGYQRIIHILMTLIWSFIVVNISLHMTESYQYVFEMTLEIGYMYMSILLFTEGDFFYNAVYQPLASQAGNILGSLIFTLFKPTFMNDFFVLKAYDQVPSVTFLTYTALICIFILLLKPLFNRLFRYREQYRYLYRIFFMLFLLSHLSEYITRVKEALAAGIQMHIMYSVLSATSALLLMGVILIISKNASLKYQAAMSEKENEQLILQYKNLVTSNDRLLKLRHEFNRQMELIREAKDYVPSDVLQNYLNHLNDVSKDFLSLSQSGSLYLDTAIEDNYSSLRAYPLVSEIVIMPLDLTPEQTKDAILISNDFFEYIKNKHFLIKWYRFTIRKRGSLLLCIMEAGYKNTFCYLLSSLSNLLFDKLVYFDHFSHIASVTRQRDGSFDLRVHKQQLTLAAMISLDTLTQPSD